MAPPFRPPRRALFGVTLAALLLGRRFARAAGAPVKAGVIGAVSDANFYIAAAKGYDRDQGLEIELVNFKEASQMVAPLSTGELDVAGGAPSAALYNALARGVGIRAVADKGSQPPLYGYTPLVVRKSLIASGRYKSLADLKGLKLGSQSPGGAATALLDRALRSAGLGLADVEIAYMGHPQLAVAVDSGAIDAAFITVPNATYAERLGRAVRVLRGDEVYPAQQLAVVMYSERFMKDRPQDAVRFMIAYLRAARLYNEALANGRFAGPAAEEVIDILSRTTEVKDKSIYRDIIPAGCNPDGRLNVASMESDLDLFRSQGLIKGSIRAAEAVDTQFADAAVAKLGPYRRQ
jgi:NitT/TauT family transport system substrate-binding protein